MAYSDFNLAKVREAFGLVIHEPVDLFAKVSSLPPSDSLSQLIRENLPFATASNTEKARSELLIAPTLLEVRRRFKLGFFSGVDFSVDPAQGLNGYCDYLLTASMELYEIRRPVVTLVEAKNENIKAGLGQCIAEMVAAQLFNQQTGEAPCPIYGCVTTGTDWKFLHLDGHHCQIDQRDYFIVEMPSILGILAAPFVDRSEYKSFS
ncbi:MAG: hypothetical protein SFW36_23140 [Leptolyngbyaceae cyanobacterium bins.59]|nr:hypothetical protein [Leptolyngbyaceae cyanobacterium bins.59]